MRFVVKEVCDGEAADFHLRFSGPFRDGQRRLAAFFNRVIADRQANGVCDCLPKDPPVVRMGDDRETAEVVAGWFCEQCLPYLKQRFRSDLPEVTRVVVGSGRSPYPAPDDRFVVLGPKEVVFESGVTVRVQRFRISRSPVTIGEFERFAAQTGYQTTAERKGAGSFRFDETIESIRAKDRKNIAVHNVSFNDATAYCQWAGVRLPTEAEWLAAAIIDDRVFEPEEAHEFLYGSTGRFEVERFPGALKDLGNEWVVGESPPQTGVLRSGPRYIRRVDWESIRHNRVVCPAENYDLLTGFRAVLS